jgi:hypothetical protein
MPKSSGRRVVFNGVLGNGRSWQQRCCWKVLGLVPIPFSNERNVMWLCNWGNMSTCVIASSFQGL